MPFPITKLPPEILYDLVVNYIDTDDRLNLLDCCDIEVSRDIYQTMFHDKNWFRHYDAEMLRQRQNAQLFVFGEPECLYFPTEGRVNHLREYSHRPARRAFTPVELSPISHTLVQISAGPSSLTRLNSEGQVYSIVPQKSSKYIERGRVREPRLSDSSHTIPWAEERQDLVLECDRVCQRFFKRDPKLIDRAVEVCSGVTGALGTDNLGMLWKWPYQELKWYGRNERVDEQGIPIVLVEDDKVIPCGVSMPRIGEVYSCCHVEGRGVMFWEVAMEQTRIHKGEGTRSGYPIYRGHFNMLAVTRVPGTVGKARDYAIAGNVLVLLDSNGKARGIDLTNFKQVFEYTNVLQIDTCGERFGFLLRDGSAIVGTPANTETISGLDLASIAVGSQHYLGLDNNGDVYSWGREENRNGCLGLGKLREISKMPNVQKGENYFQVDKPTKIRIPGRAYDIYAGIGTSIVLLHEDDRLQRMDKRRRIR